MTYSYIARQPILDRQTKTIGYELLFRDGPDNRFPDIEPELATSRLLSDHFLTAHYNTLGSCLGFVNFPYDSLINRVPTLFPAGNLVIEILEGCEPSDELLQAIKEMASAGYIIALDDFIPNAKWRPFLPYVSIIKFDIRLYSIAKAQTFMAKLKNSKIKFLAEKVETYQEFEQAKLAGFDYFQGYFFSKPELLQTKSLAPSIHTVVRLCQEIAKPEFDFVAIENLISQDLSLSFKLLSSANSSASITSQIRSFRQAVVYLGEEKLRKFVALVAIASTHDSKPEHLYTLSIQRARFCELIYQQFHHDSSSAFLTGMFSLLDSVLDQPLESILAKIPVDEEVKRALLQGEGLLGQILNLIRAYENADWSEISRISSALDLEENAICDSYTAAVKWTSDLLPA
ncbi:EAL and modified HD-GYP domain-containing signal transduction protein [Vibrio xiamenensis]|uniref:EAL and modified HD-GYP domain-containing signal transduction protein n=1 Tax=Vibrio xiamenensis TaxID=861298 RepID=A0A1G7ZAS4_9VIBR|nr:HDOD domain-containing protein [Vibrio xiamenensis]SDH05715.1 EAL and modified HD-GYP domain-containing signal transduction protein [Vibrio xiamenensis]